MRVPPNPIEVARLQHCEHKPCIALTLGGMARYIEQLEQQRQARRAGRFDDANAILEHIHQQAHAEACTHVRVHLETARLRLRQQRYAGIGKELVAAAFAAPASWVQKYFGLVRPNL